MQRLDSRGALIFLVLFALMQKERKAKDLEENCFYKSSFQLTQTGTRHTIALAMKTPLKPLNSIYARRSNYLLPALLVNRTTPSTRTPTLALLFYKSRTHLCQIITPPFYIYLFSLIYLKITFAPQ